MSSVFLLLPSLSLFPLSEPNTDWQLFSQNQAFGYSQDNAIYPLVKGKKMAYTPAKHALTFNQAELGVRYQHLSVSLLSRYEWYLRFSPDTMRLYGESVNRQDMQTGKRYDVDLRVEHLISQGIKLAWTSDVSQPWIWHLSASYLQASEMMSGRLHGHAGDTGQGEYTGLLQLDYTYTEDALLKRKVDAPSSYFGYTTDVGVSWQFYDYGFASLLVQDIYSAIYWQDMPYTSATANTATAETDEHGFVSIKPLVNGVEGFRDKTQRLPVKYHSRLGMVYQQQAYSVKSLYVDKLWLTDLEWSMQWQDRLYSKLSYNLQTGALGVEGQWGWFTLGIQSDKLDYQQAKLLNIQMGIAVDF
ncbi:MULTISPECIES: hypothetical protein [Vibrio]|uniref:hypothetical protein n=1 Tax=Vibrio TaxID=662 RepID=UPI000C16B71C|nr:MULTISPECIES: hypothetical protein [Vibrio]NNN45468.1 hypothetical protein [Vibrio sp. 1-1(7)]NNN73248.1 hypothetical protein [Vibrio sp. 12-2(3-a)]